VSVGSWTARDSPTSKANIWETDLTQRNTVVRTLETYAGMPAPSMPHLPARVFGAIHRHALGDRGPVRLAHATAHRLPRAREPDGAGNQALRSAVATPTTTTRSGVEVMDGADLSHPEGLLGGLRGTTR
jgi:hypothetical protein